VFFGRSRRNRFKLSPSSIIERHRFKEPSKLVTLQSDFLGRRVIVGGRRMNKHNREGKCDVCLCREMWSTLRTNRRRRLRRRGWLRRTVCFGWCRHCRMMMVMMMKGNVGGEERLCSRMMMEGSCVFEAKLLALFSVGRFVRHL
jgi:hypothetical protein